MLVSELTDKALAETFDALAIEILTRELLPNKSIEDSLLRIVKIVNGNVK